jgi:hypothetical protein
VKLRAYPESGSLSFPSFLGYCQSHTTFLS